MLIKDIYIIHSKKGCEIHEARLKNILEKENIKYQFVMDGDVSNFSPDLLNKYFCIGIENKLKTEVVSCTLNHILAYKKMVEDNIPLAIVLENDPFFIGNFADQIEKIYNEIKNIRKGVIISLENTTLEFPSFWQTKKNKYLYAAKISRYAGAYIIDLKAATEFCMKLKIINVLQ